MPLKFEPEIIEHLKKRYKYAILFEYAAHLGPLKVRPGELREHVFDTVDGWRIIISKDYDGHETYIHFSASCLTEKRISKEQFLEEAKKKFQEISGDNRAPELVVITNNGIPHFRINT